MFCWNCGKEISENAYVCPHCGALIGNKKAQVKTDDAPSAGFAVLCFFFPLLGLILYLIWKPEYPLKAASCGKGALIGVIVSVAFSILYVIIVVVIVATYVPAALRILPMLL